MMDLIDWLAQGFRTRDSDWGTLAIIAIGFFAVFLVSRLFLALIELAMKRPLRRSPTLLSLLVATAFWGSGAVLMGDMVVALADPRARFHYLHPDPLMLLRLFVAPFLFNPFQLLGLSALLLYMSWPAFPRSLIVASIIVTMAACGILEFFYNHNPELTRS